MPGNSSEFSKLNSQNSNYFYVHIIMYWSPLALVFFLKIKSKIDGFSNIERERAEKNFERRLEMNVMHIYWGFLQSLTNTLDETIPSLILELLVRYSLTQNIPSQNLT